VTREELSVVVAEAAAQTERAAARIETTRAEMEVWRAQHEQVVEAARVETDRLRPIWEKERAEFREERLESKRKTDQIVAELQDGRDERRALLEAIFRVMDRLD
jgi:hypothetical protein